LRIRFTRGFWTSRLGLGILAAALLIFLLGTGVFVHYWLRFSRLMDARLSGQIFPKASQVYSAPEVVAVGESLTPDELAGYLERAGYTKQEQPDALGWFQQSEAVVEVHPSEHSYFAGGDALRVEFSGNRVAAIRSLDSGQALGQAELEPVWLTNLFDISRQKRRLVRFTDLPPTFVHAVLAAEDKRFFEHPGFDALRVLGAAWADLRRGAKAQGASTITMQVARSFFFSSRRVWRRKAAETLMALELEQHFSKQKIFELYANQVYLGNRGSFAIHGFGQAAEAYFGKDLRDLSLGQQAFLAGIIRAPNHYSTADLHPGRGAEARDRVLTAMVDDRFISPAQAAAAKAQPLDLVRGTSAGGEAPYFVDMVRDHLLDRFTEQDLVGHSYRVYTTLDPLLEHAANQAVALGMQHVDELLARRYALWKKRGQPVVRPQVALVALDPRTGAIRALVGGRNYGESQLNHVLARRQPGSSFKPFVYAAALSNAVDDRTPVVTPTTMVVDEPTTFTFDGKDYAPANYRNEFYGMVTARQALTHSLNVATVKFAQMIGYGRVVEIARQMGLDPHIQATPAVALGAYDMTPLGVAAGYTAFADAGVRAEPMLVASVISSDGASVEHNAPKTRPVLDPRVAFLLTSMLEDVVNHGTGATVRQDGFTAPAAGKTGTSHDGWFAGYTSNLLAVVWVGFDDDRELGLSGSATAAVVWAELMKRAVNLPAYSRPQDFTPPPGILEVAVDPITGELATPSCPTTAEEYYIAGTQPTDYCSDNGGHMLAQAPPVSWVKKLFGLKRHEPEPPAEPGAAAAARPRPVTARKPARISPAGQPVEAAGREQEKKKGFFQKLFGIFGGGKKTPAKQPANPPDK
jgi:penicillin-binding protein 1B